MTTTAPELALGPLGQLALTVDDVPAAVRFYRDVLGVRFLFEAGSKLAFFDLGGVRLMLSAPEEDFRPGGAVLYFRVDDIRGAHRALEARGVAFERAPELVAKMPDHELWMAFFRDPSGNLLALMSEVR